MDAKQLELAGRNRAADYLSHLGLEIREHSFGSANGEIDIIAEDGDTLVFAAARTRCASWAGHPIPILAQDQLRALRTLSLRYLAESDEVHHRFRFDAISVLWDDRRPDLLHVRDVR